MSDVWEKPKADTGLLLDAVGVRREEGVIGEGVGFEVGVKGEEVEFELIPWLAADWTRGTTFDPTVDEYAEEGPVDVVEFADSELALVLL